MNENPYAPPVAPVADAEVPVSVERPRAVDRAVRLLWAGFAISVLASIAVLFAMPAGGMALIVIVMTLVGLAISGAICYLVFTAAWRGRGWARWVVTVLTGLAVVTVLGMWILLPRQPQVSWIANGSFLIRITLNIMAIALLFSAPANTWYREMKRWR